MPKKKAKALKIGAILVEGCKSRGTISSVQKTSLLKKRVAKREAAEHKDFLYPISLNFAGQAHCVRDWFAADSDRLLKGSNGTSEHKPEKFRF